MQIVEIEQNSPLWFDFRLGKIKGSSLAAMWSSRQYTKDDMVKILEVKGVEFKKSAKKEVLEELLTEEDKAVLAANASKKREFYRVMAETLAEAADDEERRNRGHRLEEQAAKVFAKRYRKKLLQVGCCVSDIDPRIINSPDRLVEPGGDGKYREAVEIKCLNSAEHLETILTNKVPEEYFTQKIQYFVVNEDLETLYFVFYDDRFKYKNLQLHVIKITRESLGDWPQTMLKFQLVQLKEMDAIIEKIAF